MINTISLESFKGFSLLEKLEFKPITIIAGTNSCGKTSILQSLLLLKQTIESQNPNQTILLNGRLVHLGNFQNLVYGKVKERDVSLKFSYSLKSSDTLRGRNKGLPLHFLLGEIFDEDTMRLRNATYFFNYELTLSTPQQNPNPSITNAPTVKRLCIKTEIVDNEKVASPVTTIEIEQSEDHNYIIKWYGLKPRFTVDNSINYESGEVKAFIRFSNLMPIYFEKVSEEKERDILGFIHFFFYHFKDALEHVLSGISYIGPLREEPARRYIYENEVVEVGIKGENAAYLYLVEQGTMLRNHYKFNLKQNQFELVNEIELSELMNNWFNYMSINGLIPEMNQEIIQLQLDSNSASKVRVNIADVGFGVSQIFPIILEGLRMPKGNLLILEQPEIHLHPNLQMQMADYFLSLALSSKNVLIETHSDHIINRIIRRIIEDDKLNLFNLLRIYFIYPTELGSKVEEVKIDPIEGIINWPKEFFDQTSEEQERIIRAGLNRKNKIKH